MAKKICLIDGSGYIFRAFYGLPPLNAPDGTPVNAVYGFTNMFLRLTSKMCCDCNLVLFDAKRQNFRNDIFPDYKATRKEIPEELIPQFPIIREAVRALNLHYLEMEGYEADDLIATYTQKALAEGMEVVVVSADKDLMQLIRKGVEFYDPMKDKFFTPEDVKEKFGVYPDKVVDVQALSGDSTDNVPGVPGIGPKTAAELVNMFGSLEEVLTHVGEIKQNKRRETLLANLENARISLRLVKLKDDVRWQYGMPPAGNANFAWLQHMIYHLAPAGKIGMVLANGSLSSQSGGEGEIRKNIVNADLVECIIAMPTQLFYTTQIPVSLWFINKQKKQSGKILFIDARKMGTMVSRKLRELTDEDILKIAGTYQEFVNGTLEDVKGFCAVADLDEVARQDYILTPGRYVGIEEQADDGEPFEEKMRRLTAELSELFDKSHELEMEIREKLGAIGYEI